jgi:hypothetical protein
VLTSVIYLLSIEPETPYQTNKTLEPDTDTLGVTPKPPNPLEPNIYIPVRKKKEESSTSD